MNELINALYGVPILGLVAQAVGYFIAVLPVIAPITFTAAIPIAFAPCAASCANARVW